ncbi:PucR family transcriptional regulator [Mycobacterium intracellulare]|uniref:Helix-turn-helix domain-containing protein n=1 Tax=Mycobacterium intracellulare subsp. chimaera TaxID=222805 RepID=A0A220Y235_MYCIT|nr:PucR family transcriptional regulator [Mycobacterium intracellulare]ASL11891.1 purine catabolism PurC domain-containing protein [Mycobacterium intracellulare subsp. chimaera]ASL17807.1 purine catabolism PurC domain-containing protein [Mycobacterium intracellulare subsp. chimaera]ASL23840.1 purine catabolism PurC domain-containing protein [Mycobacterium intracellulare subsp. chimaera]ETZ26958.1 pucR C-terminal helix-turn-helix domain protein [Mycobacterium intracellulare MIN_052511_1280]MCA2
MTKSRVFYRDSVAAADPEDADASEGLRRAPAPAPSPKPIRAQRLLVNTLLDQRADVANRVREAIVARIPAYRAIRREAVDAEVWHQFERALRSASGGHAGLDEPQWAETGASRAREGIPVDDMLRAWRIGVEVVVECASEAARREGIDDASVLEFVQSILAWSDVAMETAARAHRHTELALALAADESRAAFVRGALLGALPAAELRMHAEVHGLDPAAEYIAVRARLGDDGPQFRMEQALGFQDPARSRRGLCALVDGDLAGFLTEPPRHVDGIVGFGPPRPLMHLSESYRMAARALVTAEACGLRGAYDVASLGLRLSVVMDTDVGELLRKRYLEPLSVGGSARDLIATLRTYLACGMHVERTAARLFVHQNTVRYRLARFEELTGACLRDTEVLTEVWWVLELSAMHV